MLYILLAIGVYVILYIVGLAVYGRMEGKAKEIIYKTRE